MSNESAPEILVVDDSATIVAMVAGRLERAGYAVTAASDGQSALDTLRNAQFDIVLLDIAMPGLSGMEVLKEIRRQWGLAELPVIMTSSLDETTDVVEALEAGANDYVTKPVNFPILLARVRSQLSLKGAVSQIRRLEHDLAQQNAALEETNQRLKTSHKRLSQGLKAAAKIQQSYLPQTLPKIPGVEFAWALQACEELAGDLLNIVPLTPTCAAIYILDVSGHGVPASLLSVSLHKLLSAPSESTSLLVEHRNGDGFTLVAPSEVAGRLNRLFPMDSSTLQYFTLVYGLLDYTTRQFRYVAAGHPGPIQCTGNGTQLVHESTGIPIGWDEGSTYIDAVIDLAPGDRLYLHSDGIPEAFRADQEQFGEARMLAALYDSRNSPLNDSLDQLLAEVHRWSEGLPLRDDASILALEFTKE